MHVSSRLLLELAADQLVEDDGIDPLALRSVRRLDLHSARAQLRRVDGPFHQQPCAQDSESLEVSPCRDLRHFLGDMEPRRGRLLPDHLERRMHGIVRANEELGARLDQLVRRIEQQPPGLVPAVRVDVPHVLGQRVVVQRDLGMIVPAEQGCSLDAHGAVAERRAFGAHRGDSDVPGGIVHGLDGATGARAAAGCGLGDSPAVPAA